METLLENQDTAYEKSGHGKEKKHNQYQVTMSNYLFHGKELMSQKKVCACHFVGKYSKTK